MWRRHWQKHDVVYYHYSKLHDKEIIVTCDTVKDAEQYIMCETDRRDGMLTPIAVIPLIHITARVLEEARVANALALHNERKTAAINNRIQCRLKEDKQDV